MKSENVTKEDIKDLDLKLSKGFKILDTKIDLVNTNLSKDIKNLDNKIDLINTNLSKDIKNLDTKIDLVNTNLSKDIKNLDNKIDLINTNLSKDIKNLDTKIDLVNTNLSKDIKNLDNKIDKLENNMNDMFEKFTTVILEAIDGKSEKTVKESHENTLRIVEVERDRYSVLFEMNSDHEAKIKSLDKRVLTLEHA